MATLKHSLLVPYLAINELDTLNRHLSLVLSQNILENVMQKEITTKIHTFTLFI